MTIPGFHGRSEELAWLRGLWDACAARDPVTGRFCGGPRMAVIVAESGIGKSRLVQALYQQLTSDPRWDPPEVDYWPDAFGDSGVQLRVVPDMTGHHAKGPPRLAWLGTRWTPTDVRNVSERTSALPELRYAMHVHSEILRLQGPAWRDAATTVLEALRRDGLKETLEQVADTAMPFGGLLMKFARASNKFSRRRMKASRAFDECAQQQRETMAENVQSCMRSLLGAGNPLPTVLWLDDAQWIDSQTLAFVRATWAEATANRWPLLVVVTHWEREWLELTPQTESWTLASLLGEPGVEIRFLGPSESDALSTYLRARLPGLTPSQHDSLLAKSGGNFLTMVENVGQLLRVPHNFVDHDLKKSLAPAGERLAANWESERARRVAQRFSELPPDLQDALGWCSHVGVRFLHEVVAKFAERIPTAHDIATRLSKAVDPLAILGQPHEHLREFRDKAFHRTAKAFFDEYGAEHAEALNAVLRETLTEWVNNSYDDVGRALWPGDEDTTPERSIVGLPPPDATELLLLARAALVLPDTPRWSDPHDLAAVRSTYLSLDLWIREDESRTTLGDTKAMAAVTLPACERAVAKARADHAAEPSTANCVALCESLEHFARIVVWTDALYSEHCLEVMDLHRSLLDEGPVELRAVRYGLASLEFSECLLIAGDAPAAIASIAAALEVLEPRLFALRSPRGLQVLNDLYRKSTIWSFYTDLPCALESRRYQFLKSLAADPADDEPCDWSLARATTLGHGAVWHPEHASAICLARSAFSLFGVTLSRCDSDDLRDRALAGLKSVVEHFVDVVDDASRTDLIGLCRAALQILRARQDHAEAVHPHNCWLLATAASLETAAGSLANADATDRELIAAIEAHHLVARDADALTDSLALLTGIVERAWDASCATQEHNHSTRGTHAASVYDALAQQRDGPSDGSQESERILCALYAILFSTESLHTTEFILRANSWLDRFTARLAAFDGPEHGHTLQSWRRVYLGMMTIAFRSAPVSADPRTVAFSWRTTQTIIARVSAIEACADGDSTHLTPCAEFWETLSATCAATGDSTAAATHAARAAGLRARIAALTDEADDSAAAPLQ
jgi:hypothetical protein